MTTEPESIVVETGQGPGRLFLHPAPRRAAKAVSVLVSHGAGNGSNTLDLMALAEVLPQRGINLARFDQPWKVAGRKVATAPSTLDVALTAAAEQLSQQWQGPLILGGRSAGARSACRCSLTLAVEGVLAISFPLHPPGRAEKTRLTELLEVSVPTLLIQGERDSMGRPEEFPKDLWSPPARELYVVDQADHGLKVPKSSPVGAEQAYRAMGEKVVAWVESLGLV